jgi:ADP-ribose pyrophosphatase YjhB (NUDIX family)
MPFTRVEIAVLSVVDGRLCVLLTRRAEEPHAGKWALPGGVLRIDLDGSLDAAAQRVAKERLGLEMPTLRQLCAVGGPGRDPRAPWGLSVVYRTLTAAEQIAPAPGKRVDELAWRPVDDAVADKKIAFDHAHLIEQAVTATRAEVKALKLPFVLLPNEFTLGDLQAACEQVLGERLDKSSFRRRLAAAPTVDPVHGAMRGGANRPAQLYRAPAS